MGSIDAKIRKQRSILLSSGLGVILFGIWSIVKFILMRYMDISQFERLIGTIEELPPKTYETFMFIFILVFLIFDLGARLYIGKSAISEGRRIYKLILN